MFSAGVLLVSGFFVSMIPLYASACVILFSFIPGSSNSGGIDVSSTVSSGMVIACLDILIISR